MTGDTSRWIKKIRLENFQSHKDTIIELESGINLITGSSDAGKTAILRALNFVLHNDWSPDYLRFEEDECRITIMFSDGTKVQRIKGTKRNAVLIKHPNGDYEAHEKFGTTYPPEVVKALGDPPSDDRHGAISFAEQDAPLFLVSLSPTDLPRSISELTGIDDFDEAAMALSRRAKSADKQAKESGVRIAKHDKDLAQYEGLDEELDKLNRLIIKEQQIDDLLEDIEEANDLIEKYTEVMTQGRTATRILKSAQQIVALNARFQLVVDRNEMLGQVVDLEKSYETLIKDESFALDSLAKAMRVADSKFQIKLSAITDSLSEVKNISNFRSSYDKIVDEEQSVLEHLSESQAECDDLIAQINTIKLALLEDGLWCSSCNRPLVGEEA